jgi:ParB-like chromosome segregation protein Spo0J
MKREAKPAGLHVEFRPIESLEPYARNARTHSAAQLAQLKALMVEYGWTNPVLADPTGIIAGHGRVLAAAELYAEGKAIALPSGELLPQGTVPVLDCTGWSDLQRRAYIIADNKSALNAGWDTDALQLELQELDAAGFAMEIIGFDEDELAALIHGGDSGEALRKYARTVVAPDYVPKGDKPKVGDLLDGLKYNAMIQAIKAEPSVSDEEREFLLTAATRHIVFDYHQVAEFYCHASPAMQTLMEDSALVIIDFERAISQGFVRMNERLDEVFVKSYPGVGGQHEPDAD